jgi:DNA-binding LacI/PurR family transcriptional regulator
MDDVAREANVSRSLVSLVMRDVDKVSDERRKRVHDAASRLGYRPNASARNLASRRTNTVGVLLNNLHNPFFAEIVDGIEEQASTCGFRLLILTGGKGGKRELAMLEALLEYRTEGLILVSPNTPGPKVAAAVGTVPCVVIGRRLRSPSLDYVLTDEAVGAQLAVEHLVGLGHRRIAHVDGGRHASAVARRAGYQRAMEDAGLGRTADVIAGGFNEDAGAHAAQRLLNCGTLPTAVIAANDLIALGLIDHLERKGVRVPDAVSVVGYDNTMIAGLSHINLTTINQPGSEMGHEAFGLVLERTRGRDTRSALVHQPTLVLRSTTAPPRH